MANRHPPLKPRTAFRPSFAAALVLVSLASSLPIAASAPTNGTGLEGSYDNGSVPADTTGAVSGTHVLTTVNGGVRIHTRAGALVSSETLNAFWTLGTGGGTFDPRTVYDPYGSNGGRFITTVLAGPASARMYGIAASTGGNPTGSGSFHKYIFTYDTTGSCTLDYSTVGFNKDWIVASYKIEQVGGGPACAFAGGVYVVVLQKAQVYSGQTASLNGWSVNAASMCGGSCDRPIMPATTFSSTLDRVYLVNEYNRDAGQLQVRTISGPVSAPVLSAATTVTAPGSATWGSPPHVPQQGTTSVLDTRGTKIDSLVYRNDALWAAQTVGLPASGPTRAAIQWWQIDTAGAVKQFGRVDDTSGKHRIYGSLAVNSNDDVLIGYTLTSSSMYPSVAYAWRQGNTAKNALGGIDVVAQSGQGPYTAGGASNPRWGDYSQTVVDPTNNRHMWTLQLHSTNDNHWRAYWQQVQFYAGPFDPTFNQVRGNEWWVQAQVATSSAAVSAVEVQVNNGAWQPLSWQGWGWGASYHVTQGSVVRLRAHSVDGSMVLSDCYQWIPPANTDASVTSCNVPFDASYSRVRGNEWWVQADVTSTGPAVAAVDVRVNGGAWQPLTKQTWGAWAASYHITQGSVVQLRATGTNGATELSGCYQWIPPTNTDASVVSCTAVFDATFSGPVGNDFWVQIHVAANKPVTAVDARINCAGSWRPLTLQPWGDWAASFNVPSGSKVDFRATANTAETDLSGGYIWPNATPTTPC